MTALSGPQKPWDSATFEQALRAKGTAYHIHHPFNLRLNEGRASAAEIRGWVANRFYYQINIPRKDAAVLTNCPDREVRRQWVRRILDHDGTDTDPGGIEAWVKLGEAVGISSDELWSQRAVVPGVRFAVDAYVNFARRQPWQESVCASLTELFAPQIHRDRLATWPVHYPWIDSAGLDYFRTRIPLAARDVEHGLKITLGYFTTREAQDRALEILQFKLDILWSMLDAIELHFGRARD